MATTPSYPPAVVWEGTDAMTPDDYDMYRECKAEQEAEAGYERWLENGGAYANAIAMEAEMDRRRGWF